MKELLLVGLKSCAHCLRVVAILSTEDEKQKLAIGLDPSEGPELARMYHRRHDQAALTQLLLQMLDICGFIPRTVIFDCGEDEILVAGLSMDKDGDTQTFFCSPSMGLRIGVAADIPMFAKDEALRRREFSHPPFFEDGSIDLLRSQPKDTSH